MTSKADILAAIEQGTGATHWVDAPELGDGIRLAVRPLSKGEVGRVNARAMRGQTIHADATRTTADDVALDLDLEQLVLATTEAETAAVAYGLSVGEDWSETEVDRLPAPVQERVLAKVREVTDDDELLEDAATFRSQFGGA